MALLLKNVGKTFENTGQATLKNINLEKNRESSSV